MCVCAADLTPEQLEYKELAAKFCREEIIPNAAHYDKTGDVCTSICMYGCAVLLCLVVCLTLLASFFLPSLNSH